MKNNWTVFVKYVPIKSKYLTYDNFSLYKDSKLCTFGLSTLYSNNAYKWPS